ncbi:tumor necrosis factor alpha-induced protein 2 isoform X2 [Sardina pilchardus]|uniref:tumor necrosis factor alpha-induced protein 2 isoform X2 n=1 Tax=Sardina pilchardus TaxID=27697 RepID=UPI002E0DDF25
MIKKSHVAQALSAVRSKVEKPLARCKHALTRNQHAQDPDPDPSGALGGEVPQVPTFEDNLQRRCFSEASLQLIGREESLFGSGQQKQEEEADLQQEEEAGLNQGEEAGLTQEEEAGLKYDYERLWEEGIKPTIRKSLQHLDQSDQGALKEAVLAIQQEEEQDRRWEGPQDRERPDWRPWCYRHAHDALLEEMVRERMQEVEPYPGGGSSVQRELIGLGQRIREDMLQVARQVRGCYPGNRDVGVCCYPGNMHVGCYPGNVGVCQAYARLYHQAFSARLTELSEFGLDLPDCTHLLSWTNQHYPRMLQEPELVCEVDIKEPLLPADVLRPLEEQYMEHRETELKRCVETVLQMAEQAWRGGATQMIDGCYSSPLAIDTIQCVDANLKSCREILGDDSTHTHTLLATLIPFFRRYKHFLERVLRQSGAHSRPVVMANLTCLRQFREFVTGETPFPDDVRISCVSLVTNMRDACHTHLTSVIHQNIKETYRKLWSHNWLQKSGRVCEQLRDGLNTHLQDLTALDHTSRQELLGVLHEEVLLEYVRRMMKRKIKLKDKQQQEQAATALCSDNQDIHTVFMEAGSTEGWISKVLPELANLLKIQDPDAILLQLVTLTAELPDISVGHVSALLQLRGGLSDRDCKKIKETFTELSGSQNTHTHTHTRLFFSKVKLT